MLDFLSKLINNSKFRVNAGFRVKRNRKRTKNKKGSFDHHKAHLRTYLILIIVVTVDTGTKK